MWTRLKKRIIYYRMSEVRGPRLPSKELEPEAKEALGKLSPEAAWAQIQSAIVHDLMEHGAAAREVVARENLGMRLEDLIALMPELNPVLQINLLVESNPDLDLTDIPHLPALTVLKAVAETRTTNDRQLSI